MIVQCHNCQGLVLGKRPKDTSFDGIAFCTECSSAIASTEELVASRSWAHSLHQENRVLQDQLGEFRDIGRELLEAVEDATELESIDEDSSLGIAIERLRFCLGE